MTKASINFKGQVAEILENQGKMNARVVCDTDHMLVSLENIANLELGNEVMIEGELHIQSIKVHDIEVYKTDKKRNQ